MCYKEQFRTIAAMLMLILSINTTAQQGICSDYQDSMAIVLKGTPNVKDFFFDKEYYKNKQLKHLKLYVKFKSDSVDRYIHVGKCYHYRKNGMLKHAHHKDLISLHEIGTEIFYNKKGEVSFVIENNETSTSEFHQIDTAKYIDIKNNFSKHYWVKDSGLVFFTGKHKGRNLKISKALPKYYLVVGYYKGCKSEYAEFWYNPSKKNFVRVKKEKYLVDLKE